MDCTYKENQYNIPLLSIVDMTNCNQSFRITTVFLIGEKQSHYSWALGNLSQIMTNREIRRLEVIVTDRDLESMHARESLPSFSSYHHLLCQWHTFKELMANTKKILSRTHKKWLNHHSRCCLHAV